MAANLAHTPRRMMIKVSTMTGSSPANVTGSARRRAPVPPVSGGRGRRSSVQRCARLLGNTVADLASAARPTTRTGARSRQQCRALPSERKPAVDLAIANGGAQFGLVRVDGDGEGAGAVR